MIKENERIESLRRAIKLKKDNLSLNGDILYLKALKKYNNLNELKYLIVDTLFLTFDLNNFYKLKEFERFKMRFANYVNKRRRDEMLKSF